MNAIATNRLLAAHDVAAQMYVRDLRGPDGDGPRRYLAERGVAEVLDDPGWTIGYAARGWMHLRDELKASGIRDDEALAAGLLVRTRRGTLVDRFRDRIVFGLRDTEGRLVGFVGRRAPRAAPRVPKYLNSPRTEIFDKGHILFGLPEQRAELTAGHVPVLVEGPLDALAVRRLRGEHVAVAPCGTALTISHAQALRDLSRRSHRVLLAYDTDEPGQAAVEAAYGVLIMHFPRVLRVDLPAGSDPAEVGAADSSALHDALRRAGPAADLLLDRAVAPYLSRLDNAEARVCALHAASRVVAHLAVDDVSRQVARLSGRLGFATDTVTRDVLDVIERGTRPQASTSPVCPQPTRVRDQTTPAPECPGPSRKVNR